MRIYTYNREKMCRRSHYSGRMRLTERPPTPYPGFERWQRPRSKHSEPVSILPRGSVRYVSVFNVPRTYSTRQSSQQSLSSRRESLASIQTDSRRRSRSRAKSETRRQLEEVQREIRRERRELQKLEKQREEAELQRKIREQNARISRRPRLEPKRVRFELRPDDLTQSLKQLDLNM